MTSTDHATVTSSSVFRLSWPMIVSNITTPILGLVDTAVIGHLDHPSYIGAVSMGGLLFGFLFWGFGFLRMSTTGVAAQAVGRKDGDELRAILCRSLLFASMVAGILVLARTPLANSGFDLLSATQEVEQKARLYYDIRIWSAPFVLFNYTLIGWFIGAHSVKATLVMTLMINMTNIILDLVFVVYLDMRIEGVALASLIAEGVGVVVGITLVPSVLSRYTGRLNWLSLLDLKKITSLAGLNADVFIRTVCLIFAFAWFTNESAKQGDVILAVNTVLLNFQTLMAYALDGIANAAEVLVGQAVGREDPQLFWRTVLLCGQWSAIAALLFTLLYAVVGQSLVELLTDLTQVRELTRSYIRWPMFLPLISFWSFLFDGIFVGATWSKGMRNSMLISTMLIYLPAWYVFLPLGNHGLWLAFTLFMTGRAITQAFIFYVKKLKDFNIVTTDTG
ncbi:MAG: MATE family efflux transporter [Gammaproteobacteria bacterium]|nr:MATE family efflux transporter [Gammaproteobacteria bacterium]